MPSFQSRVEKAMQRGDLTIMDLRTWFDRPYATVWNWVNSGWEPGHAGGHKRQTASGRKAEIDLDLLEKAVALKLVPLPPVSHRARRTYVREAYNAAGRARLPQAHSAK